jgi:hypothetical protein
MIIDTTHLPLDLPSDVKADFGVRDASMIVQAGNKIKMGSNTIGATVAKIRPRATMT